MNSKQMKEFMKALESIVEEKKVDKKIVIESMEQAMAAAYKKETGMPNVTAKVDPVTGDIRLYSNRTVVEEVTNEETEISLIDIILSPLLSPASRAGFLPLTSYVPTTKIPLELSVIPIFSPPGIILSE